MKNALTKIVVKNKVARKTESDKVLSWPVINPVPFSFWYGRKNVHDGGDIAIIVVMHQKLLLVALVAS